MERGQPAPPHQLRNLGALYAPLVIRRVFAKIPGQSRGREKVFLHSRGSRWPLVELVGNQVHQVHGPLTPRPLNPPVNSGLRVQYVVGAIFRDIHIWSATGESAAGAGPSGYYSLTARGHGAGSAGQAVATLQPTSIGVVADFFVGYGDQVRTELNFYCAMLCMRSTSHGPVSVCLFLSVCLSVSVQGLF